MMRWLIILIAFVATTAHAQLDFNPKDTARPRIIINADQDLTELRARCFGGSPTHADEWASLIDSTSTIERISLDSLGVSSGAVNDFPWNPRVYRTWCQWMIDAALVHAIGDGDPTYGAYADTALIRYKRYISQVADSVNAYGYNGVSHTNVLANDTGVAEYGYGSYLAMSYDLMFTELDGAAERDTLAAILYNNMKAVRNIAQNASLAGYKGLRNCIAYCAIAMTIEDDPYLRALSTNPMTDAIANDAYSYGIAGGTTRGYVFPGAEYHYAHDKRHTEWGLGYYIWENSVEANPPSTISPMDTDIAWFHWFPIEWATNAGNCGGPAEDAATFSLVKEADIVTSYWTAIKAGDAGAVDLLDSLNVNNSLAPSQAWMRLVFDDRTFTRESPTTSNAPWGVLPGAVPSSGYIPRNYPEIGGKSYYRTSWDFDAAPSGTFQVITNSYSLTGGHANTSAAAASKSIIVDGFIMTGQGHHYEGTESMKRNMIRLYSTSTCAPRFFDPDDPYVLSSPHNPSVLDGYVRAERHLFWAATQGSPITPPRNSEQSPQSGDDLMQDEYRFSEFRAFTKLDGDDNHYYQRVDLGRAFPNFQSGSPWNTVWVHSVVDSFIEEALFIDDILVVHDRVDPHDTDMDETLGYTSTMFIQDFSSIGVPSGSSWTGLNGQNGGSAATLTASTPWVRWDRSTARLYWSVVPQNHGSGNDYDGAGFVLSGGPNSNGDYAEGALWMGAGESFNNEACGNDGFDDADPLGARTFSTNGVTDPSFEGKSMRFFGYNIVTCEQYLSATEESDGIAVTDRDGGWASKYTMYLEKTVDQTVESMVHVFEAATTSDTNTVITTIVQPTGRTMFSIDRDGTDDSYDVNVDENFIPDTQGSFDLGLDTHPEAGGALVACAGMVPGMYVVVGHRDSSLDGTGWRQIRDVDLHGVLVFETPRAWRGTVTWALSTDMAAR